MIDLIKIRNWSRYYAKGLEDNSVGSEDLAQEVCLKLLRLQHECTNYQLYVKHTFLDMLKRERIRSKNDTEWYFLYHKENPDVNNLVLFREVDTLNSSRFARKGNEEFSLYDEDVSDAVKNSRLFRFRNFIKDKL